MKPIDSTHTLRKYAFKKLIFFTVGLLCIWISPGMPAAPGRADAGDVEISVFDASTGMASGSGEVWKLILDYVADKEGWSIHYVQGTLDQGLEQLANEKIDLLTSFPHRPAMDVPDIVSQEAVISTWVQVYTNTDVSLNSLLGLNERTVGVVEGDFNNSEFRDILTGLGIDLMLVEFKSGDDLLAAIDAKWVDAGVVDRFFGALKIRDYDVVRTPIIFSPMEYRFAAPPALKDKLLNVIDFHLRAMKKDANSSYQRYLTSIFGENKELRLLKHLEFGLMVVAICLLGVGIHAFVLRYRVKERTSELSFKNKELRKALALRQKAEIAHRDSEDRFYGLFHASPQGIAIHKIVLDPSGRAIDYVIVETNAAFTTHSGLTREDVVGKCASQAYGADQPPFLDIYAKTTATGRSNQFEAYVDTLNRFFRITVFLHAPGQFVTVFEDISDRKKSEESIKSSEEKYRLLVENAHDLIVVIQNGFVKFANPAALNTFGYAKEEIRTLSLPKIVHSEDLRDIMALDWQNMETAQSPYHNFRGLTRSGQVRWLQMNAIRIDWGRQAAALCLVRDITKTKKMENQLAQAQKMQAVGTLAGGVAHDFNNILYAIIGYAELCQLDITSKDILHQNLEQILKAGQRATDLVNQILTFSHQTESDKKPIDTRYCIKEALTLLRATIPSNINIRQNIQKDQGVVLADPTQIHQIIMNLCTNAAHAMQEEGGVLEVVLRNHLFEPAIDGFPQQLEPGSYVGISVSDTGHGMTPETVQRIFEPYFTTKKQGEGTGLGLSMVHGIVADLKGEIKIYSELGTGTTINVYLPRIEAPSKSERSITSAIPRGSETLLIVDDEQMLVKMTHEMMEKLGYNVFSRTSSVEAFNAFYANPDRFDLVITDQTMPNMTGKELAKKILHIRPDMPIILCTGFSASINEEKALSIGIGAFIKKPILRSELATMVRQLLDGPSN